jgi:hypothetical protein
MTVLSLLSALMAAVRLVLVLSGLSLHEQVNPADKPQETPQPATQPATQPVTQPETQRVTQPATGTTTIVVPRTEPAAPAAGSATFADAEALLDALERADAGLKSLRADVRYDKIFEDQGDRQTRFGRLMFRAQPPLTEGGPALRSFALLIDELLLGTRSEKKLTMIVFNGEWFVEKVPSEKRFTKRRIAKPGDAFDPFKVGEGQFPLPIGQKKADILSRFDAKLLPATEGLDGDDAKETAELRAFVEGTYQLRLTIRPELRAAAEMREIRLWYKPQVRSDGSTHLLPRLARTTHRGGTLSLVRLLNVTVNQSFDGDPFDVSNPPSDWEISIQDELAAVDGR